MKTGMRRTRPQILGGISLLALLGAAALLLTGIGWVGVAEHPASPVKIPLTGTAVLHGPGGFEIPLAGDGSATLPVLRPGVYRIDGGWPHPGVGKLLPPRVLKIADGPGSVQAGIPVALLALWLAVAAGSWYGLVNRRASHLLAGVAIIAGLAAATGPGAQNLAHRAAFALLAAVFATSLLNRSQPTSGRFVLCAAAAALGFGVLGVIVPGLWAAGVVALATFAVSGRRAAMYTAGAGLTAALLAYSYSPGINIEGTGTLEQLAGCFNPDVESPEEMRCAQTAIILAGVSGEYRTAAAEVLRVSHSDLTVGPQSGQLCRLGGNVLAEAAVVSGQDPVLLLDTEDSVCDFSLPHGVASAVSFWADNPAEATAELCQDVERGRLRAFTVGSQCWHGAGQGVARRTAFDFSTVALFCRTAPNLKFMQNCMEGALIEGLDAAIWNDGLPSYKQPRSQITLKICAETFPDEYLESCYRYGADVARRLEGERVATEIVAALCSEPDVRGSIACWQAYGDILGHWQAADPDAIHIDNAIAKCQRGETWDTRQVCVLRLINTLLSKTDLSAINELLAYVPAEYIDTVAPAVREFAETIQGL